MSRTAVRQSPAKAGDRSYLRRLNSVAVLDQLWKGPATVSAVAQATMLSRTAAEAVIGDLIAAGWVVDGGPLMTGELAPGRPASVYRMASEAGTVAGVDMGAHHISVRVATLGGDALVTLHREADERMAARARVELAVSVLRAALDSAKVAENELWLVTVGVPGVIEHGKVAHFGGEGMPGWIGFDVEREMLTHLDVPIRVEGDSALGAVAEISMRPDRSDLVYILSGVRTGAALVIGGALHRGSRGGAGLVGELPQLRWRDLELESYGLDAYPEDRPDRVEIFRRARQGDEAARLAVKDFADALAEGTAAMALAIDPEAVVIGGPNSRDAELFIERFVERLRVLCPLPPEVEISSLGSDAVLIGAIQHGIDTIRRTVRHAADDLPAFPTAHAALLA